MRSHLDAGCGVLRVAFKKEGKPYRLPTEAEWEYACRAGTESIFHTGDTLPAGHQKWFGEQGRRSLYFPDGKLPPEYDWQVGAPSPRVGQTTPNAWGLQDMHGNVAEWCLDWYGPYESSDQIDPLGRSEGDFRVFRGGGHSMLAQMLRSANRGGWVPDSRPPWVGFRVVLADLPEGKRLPPPPAPLNAQHVSQAAPAIVPPAGRCRSWKGPVSIAGSQKARSAPFSPGTTTARPHRMPERGPARRLVFVHHRTRARTVQWREPPAFRRKDWEAPSPFLGCTRCQRSRAEVLVGRREDPLHFTEARGFADANIFRTSTDNGATWSQAKVFFPRGETGNSIIRTREGVLAIAIDGRSLIISRDNGLTWTRTRQSPRESRPSSRRTAAPASPASIAAVVELADGRLMAMGRFDDVDDQERFGFKMPVSYSSDLGETWHYEASDFPVVSNTQRPVLLRLMKAPSCSAPSPTRPAS